MPRPKGSRINSTGKRGTYTNSTARSNSGRKAAYKAHITAIGTRRGKYVKGI